MSAQWDRQRWAARAELERRLAPDGLKWGEAIYNGRHINIYFNSDLIKTYFTLPISRALPQSGVIRIADFCCDTGLVAQTVALQLDASHRSRTRLVGVDHYDDGLKIMKQRAYRVRPVQGDLKNIPFAPNSFHAGIFRFALPFIAKDTQPKVFDEIYNVMKKGSVLAVLNYGTLTNTKMADAYDELFNQGTASLGRRTVEEVRNDMHIPSFARMKEMAESAGFKVRPVVDLTYEVLGYISPEIYGGLYKLKGDQLGKLRRVFKKEKHKGILPFEPGTLRVIRPMYTCVLEK